MISIGVFHKKPLITEGLGVLLNPESIPIVIGTG
jgi:hypothetical protein